MTRGLKVFVCLVDFDNADALLVSEVKMLLEHRKAQHESQDDDQDLSEVCEFFFFCGGGGGCIQLFYQLNIKSVYVTCAYLWHLT